jgi:pyruvate,water dikinase
MVRSDLAGSGVLFSIDTETGFRDVVLINAAWRLGESVVQGTVNPDEYVVFKPTLASGFRPILRRRPGSKEWKLVYEHGGSKGVRSVPVPEAERAAFVLSDDEILTLARWACAIEAHYSAVRGVPTPMDVEWAKDGRSGESCSRSSCRASSTSPTRSARRPRPWSCAASRSGFGSRR